MPAARQRCRLACVTDAVTAMIGVRRAVPSRRRVRRISIVAVVAVEHRDLAVHQDRVVARAVSAAFTACAPSPTTSTVVPEVLEHRLGHQLVHPVVLDQQHVGLGPACVSCIEALDLFRIRAPAARSTHGAAPRSRARSRGDRADRRRGGRSTRCARVGRTTRRGGDRRAGRSCP